MNEELLKLKDAIVHLSNGARYADRNDPVRLEYGVNSERSIAIVEQTFQNLEAELAKRQYVEFGEKVAFDRIIPELLAGSNVRCQGMMPGSYLYLLDEPSEDELEPLVMVGGTNGDYDESWVIGRDDLTDNTWEVIAKKVTELPPAPEEGGLK